MSTIYGDQHTVPSKSCSRWRARREDATLLIPDSATAVCLASLPSDCLLVDSLIRGWPFGTLLTWKVRPDDPARDLARPFWRVRRPNRWKTTGRPIGMKRPPASFQMVLDGQQRVQSLLLALGRRRMGIQTARSPVA